MNVCFVVPALVSKAPIVLMLSLARYLLSRGAEVTFLYFDENVSVTLPEGARSERVSVWKRYDFSRFDIVHSSLLRSDFFVFLNARKKIKTVFLSTVHSYIKEDLYFIHGYFASRLFSFFWRSFWLRQDAVVVLSQHARNYYGSLALKKKLHVIYNGLDVVRDADFSASSQLSEVREFRAKCALVIGSYCVITAQKGLEQLIHALSRHADLGVIIVGNGQEKSRLVELSVSLDVADRCLFIAATPDAHQYNAFFDIFAMPSRAEGFGLALIEAALHGKKIICSDIPIFREIFDERSVTYFSLDDPISLDNAIYQARTDEQKALNAHTKASTEYSLDNMASAYCLLYSELIGLKNRSVRAV